MPARPPSDPAFDELLALLSREGVRFIVVGGIAAILHGSELMTSDLDILYETSPRNIVRLLAVLDATNAYYRDPAGRHIVPDETRLTEHRVNLFMTDLGPFDALQFVGDDLKYPDLVDRCEHITIENMSFSVLSLEALIETKISADRPKDRMALPFLFELRDRKHGQR